MDDFKPNAQIVIELEGADPKMVERYRKICEVLISQKAFAVHGGKVVLHFDLDGDLRKIDFDYTRWKS